MKKRIQTIYIAISREGIIYSSINFYIEDADDGSKGCIYVSILRFRVSDISLIIGVSDGYIDSSGSLETNILSVGGGLITPYFDGLIEGGVVSDIDDIRYFHSSFVFCPDVSFLAVRNVLETVFSNKIQEIFYINIYHLNDIYYRGKHVYGIHSGKVL